MVQHYLAVVGQSNVGPNIDADLSLASNLKVYPLGSFDLRDKSFVGSSLLFTEWQIARIKLIKREKFLSEYLMINYDLEGQSFIVKNEGKLFELPSEGVDQIIIQDVKKGQEEEYMIYKDQNGIYGLFGKLVDGEIQLLTRTNVKIVEPNYNIALDVGTVRPKFVQYEELFLARNGKMYKLPKKRNQIRKSLEGQSEVAHFLTEQKVNLQDKAALKAAILKLNNKIERNEINK